MYIKKAKKSDFSAIKYLMMHYGKMHVTPEHMNSRDIALVARDAEGECIGFIWGGLMCNNTLCYVDKFCVRPDYCGKGVGDLLQKTLRAIAKMRGVKEGFAIIRRDQYHDAVAINSLKGGMGADSLPYTYIFIKGLETNQAPTLEA